MTDTYEMLGVAGTFTAPGVICFQGEGWQAVITEWGAKTENEETTWSGTFRLGNKRLLESLAQEAQDAIRSIERQVREMSDALGAVEAQSWKYDLNDTITGAQYSLRTAEKYYLQGENEIAVEYLWHAKRSIESARLPPGDHNQSIGLGDYSRLGRLGSFGALPASASNRDR